MLTVAAFPRLVIALSFKDSTAGPWDEYSIAERSRRVTSAGTAFALESKLCHTRDVCTIVLARLRDTTQELQNLNAMVPREPPGTIDEVVE